MTFLSTLKRKTVVTGHYGSGKTEFSVSLALKLTAPENRTGNLPPPRVALVDLDVINPYFRSRERRDILSQAGVSVYGGVYKTEITAEIPEIGAALRAPLEDENSTVIIDLGGNSSGALIINQFTKYFTGSDTLIAAVVNANRPETLDIQGALSHISSIEQSTGLTVSHIINNTHLLRETTWRDIEKGHKLCMEICGTSGKELLCDCYPEGVVNPAELKGFSGSLMPLGLYMRPSWLDCN